MTLSVINVYPGAPPPEQCGQKQFDTLKQDFCGGGPHCSTTRSCRLMVGILYLAIIAAAWLLRLMTQPSLSAAHMYGEVSAKRILACGCDAINF